MRYEFTSKCYTNVLTSSNRTIESSTGTQMRGRSGKSQIKTIKTAQRAEGAKENKREIAREREKQNEERKRKALNQKPFTTQESNGMKRPRKVI